MNTNAWNRIRYSIISPFYNASVAPFARSRKRSIELLNPQPGEKLLILGCGTGSDLEFIPVGVDVTAVDITSAMVQMTQRRARELHRDIKAQVMDGQALEFADAVFDGVILHLILAVIPKPHACGTGAKIGWPGGHLG